ncbi:MAG: ABC transporter ATP-binding protein [Devosia sp.]|nr:ABC transporter ATP-binding protein [Devosia sp.]
MIELALQAVSKTFGAGQALQDLDLTVRPGELMAVLGPSGCGKTTTLRVISGLDTPNSGKILFDGVDVRDRPAQDRNVGLVSQRYALFPHMSVERNISYGLRVRGVPKRDIARRVDELVVAVQLEGLCQRFPAQLSGGQMQRVALARTLITNPGLLLLDEPLASLDAQMRADLRGFIRVLQQRTEITTLLVTHDQAEAMEMADRIAIMFDGRVVQCGTPREVFGQPASVEVARFVGAANILDGEVFVRDGQPAVRSGLGVIATPSVGGHQCGDRVTFMLRPETVMLTEAGSGQTDALVGRVLAASFHGQSVSYEIDVSGMRLRVDDLSRRVLTVGQPVELAIDPHSVWVFPRLLPREPRRYARPVAEPRLLESTN